MNSTAALFVIATPIGNLADVSARTREALASLDWLATESESSARRLLSALSIRCPHLETFREDNREHTEARILQALEQGLKVGLICEAGTPAISDPGWTLVQACHRHGYPVTGIAGPSSIVLALSVSGQPTRRFFYEGFLPRSNPRRKERLAALGELKETAVILESPHGLLKTLQDLTGVREPANALTIARELTKKFEEVRMTTLAAALDTYRASEPRGEFVLVLGPPQQVEQTLTPEQRKLEQKLGWLREQGLSNRQLTQYLVEFEGQPKKEAYRMAHVDSREAD